MKSFRWTGLIAVCLSALVSAGYADNTKKTQPTAPSKNTRTAYEKEAQNKVFVMQQEMKELEVKTETMELGPRARFYHRLQMVQRKLRETEDRLIDLQKSSRSKWQSLKNKFESNWVEAQKSYQSLRAQEPTPEPH